MELEFFAALLNANDPGGLRLVDRSRDLEGEWLAVYDFVVTFQQENGRLPRPMTVQTQFSLPMTPPPEPAAYYATMIKSGAKRKALEEGLGNEVVPHLEALRPDDAMRALADVSADINSKFPESQDSRSYLPNMALNVQERWADYIYRGSLDAASGLPLPWQTITSITRGLQPGEAWCLVARPNIGKSWAALAIATYLTQIGYRVLFCSMETPPRNALPRSERVRARMGAAADVARQRLTIRVDALGARVSAWRLLNGTLTPPELDQFRYYLQCCQNPAAVGWGELRLVSSPLVRSAGQLEQYALEFQPDLVIWDSAYLAIGDRNRRTKRTDQAGYFLEDTKYMFERLGIPGLITWHFNREVKETDTHASMNDIALTDDMGRLFDVILALFRTPDHIAGGEALWRTLKVRDGVGLTELRSRFEIKSCVDFSEIGMG